MVERKVAHNSPLDELVLRVRHLELSKCNSLAEFKEALAVMESNLEETLAVLATYSSPSAAIHRAAETVKLRAVLLLDLCSKVSKSLDNEEKWQEAIVLVIANYDQFRIIAGHLYQLAVPRAGFGVLRAAL